MLTSLNPSLTSNHIIAEIMPHSPITSMGNQINILNNPRGILSNYANTLEMALIKYDDDKTFAAPNGSREIRESHKIRHGNKKREKLARFNNLINGDLRTFRNIGLNKNPQFTDHLGFYEDTPSRVQLEQDDITCRNNIRELDEYASFYPAAFMTTKMQMMSNCRKLHHINQRLIRLKNES